jgi:hypothetical protein
VYQTHPDHGEKDRNEFHSNRPYWEFRKWTPALALCPCRAARPSFANKMTVDIFQPPPCQPNIRYIDSRRLMARIGTMQITDTDEDGDAVEIVPMELPLDRDTVSWLARMAKDDRQAASMIASMLKEIRRDDEAADRVLH